VKRFKTVTILLMVLALSMSATAYVNDFEDEDTSAYSSVDAGICNTVNLTGQSGFSTPDGDIAVSCTSDDYFKRSSSGDLFQSYVSYPDAGTAGIAVSTDIRPDGTFSGTGVGVYNNPMAGGLFLLEYQDGTLVNQTSLGPTSPSEWFRISIDKAQKTVTLQPASGGPELVESFNVEVNDSMEHGYSFNLPSDGSLTEPFLIDRVNNEKYGFSGHDFSGSFPSYLQTEAISPDLNLTSITVNWDGYSTDLPYEYARANIYLSNNQTLSDEKLLYGSVINNQTGTGQINLDNGSFPAYESGTVNGYVDFSDITKYEYSSELLGEDLKVTMKVEAYNSSGDNVRNWTVAETVRPSLKSQGGFFAPVFNAIDTILDITGLDALIQFIQDIIEGINDVFNELGIIATNIIDGIGNALDNVIQGLQNAIQSFIQGVIDFIRFILVSLYVGLTTLISVIVNAITLFFSFLINTVDILWFLFMNSGLEVQGELDRNNETFTYYSYTGDYNKTLNETNATFEDTLFRRYELNTTYSGYDYIQDAGITASEFNETQVFSFGNTGTLAGVKTRTEDFESGNAYRDNLELLKDSASLLEVNGDGMLGLDGGAVLDLGGYNGGATYGYEFEGVFSQAFEPDVTGLKIVDGNRTLSEIDIDRDGTDLSGAVIIEGDSQQISTYNDFFESPKNLEALTAVNDGSFQVEYRITGVNGTEVFTGTTTTNIASNYSADDIETVRMTGNNVRVDDVRYTYAGEEIAINTYTTDYDYPEGVPAFVFIMFFILGLFMAVIEFVWAIIPEPIRDGIGIALTLGNVVVAVILEFLGVLTWILNLIFVDGVEYTIMFVKYGVLFKGLMYFKKISQASNAENQSTMDAIDYIINDVMAQWDRLLNITHRTYDIADKVFRTALDIIRTIAGYIPFI